MLVKDERMQGNVRKKFYQLGMAPDETEERYIQIQDIAMESRNGTISKIIPDIYREYVEYE